jgi:hypothetical protein
MPRGGFRPGAGRPKGSKTARPGVAPLEYMLAVMNDVAADDARRDRMAIAAAPFVHARSAQVPADPTEGRAA